jgi:pyruvate dehydrogenase E2 component (dihydrolipoamide acetyltransferase)
MADFTMPALGADMEAGELVQWLVQPGDRVRSGDVVAVVETHKGAIDVECFLDGVITELAPLHQPLPVGAVLARVGAAAAATTAPHSAPTGAPVAVAPRQRASPAARREAASRGLDLAGLAGTGADGAVVLADVLGAATTLAALDSPLPLRPPLRSGFDPAQMRLAIAAAMSRSKREIPHYYLTETLDFGPAQAWLDSWNAAHEPEQRLLPAALLLKAAALALAEVPQFNGFWEEGRFGPGAGIHVGWAISLRGGGLVAPAVHHADRLGLPALMAALRDLVQRARSGGLRSSELSDPTITVTSLGERGASQVLGVIYPPQVALLGLGRVQQQPWVVDGQVQPRHVVQASLAADHRASDGALGSRLLAALARALQSPETLSTDRSQGESDART